jgi:PAS domain S-box-containing protein
MTPNGSLSGSGGPDPAPDPERGAARSLQYMALALLLASGAALLPGRGQVIDPWMHVVVEALSTGLALGVGALALVLFRARGRTTYLFIATGFIAASLLDGWQALISSPMVAPRLSTPDADLAAWSWLAGRFFLALFLFAAWWSRAMTGEAGDGDRPSFRKPPAAGSLVATAGTLVLMLFFFLILVPLPAAVHPDALLPRPLELVPGFLFGGALYGVLRQKAWRKDPFEQALVFFLALSTFLQFGYVLLSADPFDALSFVGRLLKAGSYGIVATGLLITTDRVFRRERRAQAAMAEANAALTREMTARRESQRAVRDTEARLTDFLDHANDLIHSVDRNGRILYVNEAWKRRLGYSDAEIRVMHIRELLHPDSLAIFDAAAERVFAGEAVSDVPLVLISRDGTPVALSGSSNCRFEDGKPVSTRTILRDISAEREREAELARVEANLRAVFESTGDPIWSVDPQGRFVTFNTAFALLVEVITGRAPSVGATTESLMSHEAAVWFRECYDRALEGSRFSATREEDVDGQPRHFDMYFNPIETTDGRIGGVVVFARDATRRHQVEAALRRAKKEAERASETKSDFLASMSHELRTPLNSIIGFSNILLRKGIELPERERGYLDRIQANGRHLLLLINEILDLSKIEAGHMELVPEPVELVALVEETVGQLEAQVAGRPVRLGWEVSGTPDPVLADPARLKQVIINLIGNALKFTESGEVVVHVDTEADGRTPIRLRVRDTGIGIPEDRLDAIFRAFEQADAGTSRRYGGTGLGLAISSSLCALMGFDLHVQSQVGVGSEFSVVFRSGAEESLQVPPAHGPKVAGPPAPPAGSPDPAPAPAPAAPASAGPASPAPASPDGGHGDGDLVPLRIDPDDLPEGFEVRPGTLAGRTVLVVDDEADSRDMLSHLLEELGCEVVLARDGVEGLEVARTIHPDLITVDLMMPRMNGWEMLRALRDDPAVRDVPVIVVSIVAGEGGGQVLGAVDLLTKPVDREMLDRALRRNLPRAGARVLVVDDNAQSQATLLGHLEEAGFAVHGVEGGVEALRYLERVPVGLILVDLSLAAMDGLTFLRRLRASTRFARIPVVVLTSRALAPEERAMLEDAGVEVIQRAGQLEVHLFRALDGVFGRSGGETPPPSPGTPAA